MDRPIYLDMLAEQKKRICQLGVDFENFQAREIQEREDILYEHQEEYGGTNKVVNQITPLVSVCIPTYQHVEYIEQCLQGAIMQKTSFPIEIIIGDDGSVDGTVEICKKYADKYPDKIRFYDRARVLTRIFDNEGHIVRACNWWWTLKDARGKYIAMCEGDDYWTDPLKLQKQVDFLESRPDYGMCYTRVEYFSQKDNKLMYIWGREAKSGKELIEKGNSIATLTVLLRKDLQQQYLSDIHPEQRNWKMGDYPLWLWVAFHSRIKFFPDVTGVYRVLESSASHSKDINKVIDFAKSYTDIKMFFADRYCRKSTKTYKKIKEQYVLSLVRINGESNENIKEVDVEIRKAAYSSWKITIVKASIHNSLIRYCLKCYYKWRNR